VPLGKRPVKSGSEDLQEVGHVLPASTILDELVNEYYLVKVGVLVSSTGK
jgi:hypothetical protein